MNGGQWLSRVKRQNTGRHCHNLLPRSSGGGARIGLRAAVQLLLAPQEIGAQETGAHVRTLMKLSHAGNVP